MIDEHERKIMDMFLQISLIPAVIDMTGILAYTKISRSTLQRIFPRLEKRGWIEKSSIRKPIGATLTMQIDEIHLNIFRDINGEIIFMNPDTAKKKFKEDLMKLTRERTTIGKNGKEIQIESYREVLEKLYNRTFFQD